ncbi:MAG: hypothetical protein Q9200_005419 [Gallowayella weberi]
MFLSIGDILQLSRLAADLYKKGWVVARQAPQDFRDLVHELLLLKDILFIVHRKVTRESSLYGDPTREVLRRCFDTLTEFSVLVAKYEKLALSDRGHWFRRLQWSREQDSIRACRNKLQDHQRLLQLVLTPEGRTILSEEGSETAQNDGGIRWSHGFSSNLDEQSAYRERPGTSFSQPTRTKTIDSGQTLIPPFYSPPAKRIESSSQSLQRPTPLYLNADITELEPIQRSHSHLTGQSSLSDVHRSGEDDRPPRSFTKRTSDVSIEGRIRQMSMSTLRSEDSSWRQSPENIVLQPLEIPERREKHDCPEELNAAFLDSFESIGDEVLDDDESWVRIATWWLTKSQTVCRSLDSTANKPRKDIFHDYSHWENTTSKDQAYVDLLKSSWILDELIRKRKVAGDLTKLHIRKLVIDLLRALKSDLHHRQRDKFGGKVPDTNILLKQDLSLLESFEQIVEARENEPRAMDDLTTSQRWITIDKDHGGFPEERILFRSFVNAQVGQRHERSKSSNAPYVILLWTRTGESEISVSLCNQRDTMNLSRKLTTEDMEDWRSLGEEATTLNLEFPSQSAEINFLTAGDLRAFRTGPESFFHAVRGREPRPGELTIFQTVLKSYRSTDSSSSPKSFGSCELRLYEQLDEVCWKSIRRLVISSTADSKTLGSVSHWLPLSNVRLQVEDCTVTLSWSDCGHLEKKSGGNYNPYYSFIYRSDTPNQKVILVFNLSDDAQKFEDCLLYLTETPPQVRETTKIDSASAFQETRIYSLFDQDDPDRGYHGIVYAKKSPKTYHYSQIFYIYRDLDFSFQNQNPAEILLHDVRVPHYISTRHKMLSKPKDGDAAPDFREVTWALQPLPLTFSTEYDAVNFMTGLTGWRLKFYRQSAKLVLTDTSHFRKPKKTHKGAEIQLWEKAAEAGLLTQLIVRLTDGEKPWLSARLEASGGGLGLPTGGVVELKGLAFQQGKDLDTKHMEANSGEEATAKPCWKFSVTFKEGAESNEFMTQSGLLSSFTQGLGLRLENSISRLWDEARERSPSIEEDLRHQSASSRVTQASASSGFSGTTTDTTIDRSSVQGSRSSSQDYVHHDLGNDSDRRMDVGSALKLENDAYPETSLPGGSVDSNKCQFGPPDVDSSHRVKDGNLVSPGSAVPDASELSIRSSPPVSPPVQDVMLQTGQVRSKNNPLGTIDNDESNTRATEMARGEATVTGVEIPESLSAKQSSILSEVVAHVHNEPLPLDGSIEKQAFQPKSSGPNDCAVSLPNKKSWPAPSFLSLLLPETPLAAGKTRVRWTCKTCGSALYDDFTELRSGAARKLELALDTPRQQKPTYQHQPVSRDPNPTILSSVGFSGVAMGPQSQRSGSTSAATYDPYPANDRPNSAIIPCGPENKWLMVCLRAWQRPTSLLHLSVCSTASDQELFTALRQSYIQLKKAKYYRFSLKRAQSIRFVQFELHPRDLVDVRKVPDMPPQGKDDYSFQPCDLLSPVGENLMTHLFHHPHEANEMAITYRRSPKKRKEKLEVCPQSGTNVGWGIHLVEGWAITKIWILAFAVFLASSLIFAIAWALLEHDLQGAFGVSTYFVALAALVIGTIQAHIA